MFSKQIDLSGSMRPMLTVVIHTEEEFDWSRGFQRENTCVDHLSSIYLIQELFDKYSIVPVYAVDYPVASHVSACEPLRAIVESGRAEIGTHLHPWVSPPYTEHVCGENSFPGNLCSSLELEKLRQLTDKITETFQVRPRCYVAGRYGIGKNTITHLKHLEYVVDLSVSPAFDYSHDGGPDFSDLDNMPFWMDIDETIIGLPHSGSWTGPLSGYAKSIRKASDSKIGKTLKLRALLAKSRLCERIRLSPEGHTVDEMKRLTAFLLRKGVRHFVFSFHSPSIKPGCTSYVKSNSDQKVFLDSCDSFFNFFVSDLAGVFMTASQISEYIRSDESFL